MYVLCGCVCTVILSLFHCRCRIGRSVRRLYQMHLKTHLHSIIRNISKGTAPSPHCQHHRPFPCPMHTIGSHQSVVVHAQRYLLFCAVLSALAMKSLHPCDSPRLLTSHSLTHHPVPSLLSQTPRLTLTLLLAHGTVQTQVPVFSIQSLRVPVPQPPLLLSVRALASLLLKSLFSTT